MWISACTGLLLWGVMGIAVDDPAGLWRLGPGAVDPQTVISDWSNRLIVNALLANLPQPFLSFLYLTYNTLLTSMFLSQEWDRFGKQRKPLRVSSRPIGLQRTTRFLQLPFRYAIPLLSLSGLLHWLVSQSIFLVNIEAYDYFGNHTPDGDIVSLGYSPATILGGIILVFSWMLFSIGLGFCRFKTSIPVAGSCSAAISAACHLSEEFLHAAKKPLQWGVVSEQNGVGHCSFSSGHVEQPKPGKLYAGYAPIRKRKPLEFQHVFDCDSKSNSLLTLQNLPM
jgi:hypothetical protein